MALADLDSRTVVPVLDNALELAEEALLSQQDNQEKIAAKDRDIQTLRQQLADQEKVILEKVASKQVLNPIDIERLLTRFEDLHIMTRGEGVKLAAHIKRDPNLLIPIFLKAADKLSGAPSEGSGISKDDADYTHTDNRDPYGWDDLCDGRVVVVKNAR